MGAIVAETGGTVTVTKAGCGLADICATTVWATLVERAMGSTWLAEGMLHASIARIKPVDASNGAILIFIPFSSVTGIRVG